MLQNPKQGVGQLPTCLLGLFEPVSKRTQRTTDASWLVGFVHFVERTLASDRKKRAAHKANVTIGILKSAMQFEAKKESRKSVPGSVTSVFANTVEYKEKKKELIDTFGWGANLRANKNTTGLPEVWEKAGRDLHIALYHMAVAQTGNLINFTLKLSDSVIARAHKSENFTCFVREQVRRELRKHFHSPPQHWFVIECFSTKGTEKVMHAHLASFEPTKPHLHGAIELKDTPSNRRRLRSALKQAGGADYPAKGKQLFMPKRDYLADGRFLHWAARYATKTLDLADLKITGRGYVVTRDLPKRARKLYEFYRSIIVAHYKSQKENKS